MNDQVELQPLPEDWDRALAIVAHPDDMEYAASSAVARWTQQGKTVDYVLLTRGEAGIDSMTPEETGVLREQEEIESAAIVGVKSVEFLGYPDGVIEYGLPLRKDLARAIRKHRPEVIVTISHHLTWGGGALNMADHRWTGLALLDAARDAGNRWIFPELMTEGFEPWGGVRMVCVNSSPEAAHAVDVTHCFETGVASLKAHRVYLDHLGGGSELFEFLRNTAIEAGKRFGCDFAVTFEVIHI